MLKRTVYIPLICLLSGITLIALLYYVSPINNNKNNGFARFFPSHLLNDPMVYDLKYNSYYIVGAANSHIYMGNTIAPTYLLMADFNLGDTQSFRIKIKNKEELIATALQVVVDSPNIYAAEGMSPVILTGNFPNIEMMKLNLSNIHSFSLFLPISPQSAILRTYDSALQQNILMKVIDGPPLITGGKVILEKRLDGYFDTDGMINYDPTFHMIVYVYYYQNSFLLMDTNLNIIYTGNTIDTITTPQIKVSDFESNASKTVTLSAPPVFVNKRSCIFGDLLYINSGRKASNEEEEKFNASSVIDVYSLRQRKYKYSFYIPRYGGNKMSGFYVRSNLLFSLHGRYLVRYRLKTEQNFREEVISSLSPLSQ